MSKVDSFEIPADWTFKDAGVAKNFDQHVRETLPWYDMVTGAVAHLVRHYLPEKGLIYDIGASTGNIGRAIEKTLIARDAVLIPVEPSEDMVKQYEGPFAERMIQRPAQEMEFLNADVFVLFLVLMFVPVCERDELLDTILNSIRPGGCAIIVDKLTQDRGYLSTVFHRLTLAGKVATNIPSDQIIGKELSLSGLQRPIRAELMEDRGGIEFFKFGEFAGWVIEK